MVKLKKSLTPNIPRIHLSADRPNADSRESSLLKMRLKELDEEFFRQTKHLAHVTRKFRNKVINKF